MNSPLENPILPLEKKPFADSLKGLRVQLVRSHPSYAKQVLEYIQRDHTLGGKNYSWVETLDDVIKHVIKEPNAEGKAIDYLILKDLNVIGSFHVHTISYRDHKAEIGYGIEKREEGKGYVSESLQLVLAEMKRLGFNKVIISCDRDNVRSIKVAERNGFIQEGMLIQDCVENGCFRDSILFGRILR